jgi:hypothetical protein
MQLKLRIFHLSYVCIYMSNFLMLQIQVYNSNYLPLENLLFVLMNINSDYLCKNQVLLIMRLMNNFHMQHIHEAHLEVQNQHDYHLLLYLNLFDKMHLMIHQIL